MQAGTMNYDIKFFKSMDMQQRYGAMLLFVGTLVMVEGMVRYIESEPKTPYESMTGMQYRLVVAGAAEVFFGCLTMVTAFCILALHATDPILPFASLFTQVLCGAYVFAVYAIERPVHNFENDMSPPVFPPDSFSRDQLHTALSFGYIIGSVTACAIVFGFLIFCTAVLVAIQGDMTAIPDNGLASFSFWNIFLIAWLGVSMLVLGSMISDQEGSREIDGVYIFPPNFVKSAPQTLTSGSLLVIYAFVLIFGALGWDPMLFFSSLWGIITWIYLVADHVMAQISNIEVVTFGGAAAALVCLMTGVVFIPLFLVSQMDHHKRWAIIEEEVSVQRRVGETGVKPSAVEVSHLPSSPL